LAQCLSSLAFDVGDVFSFVVDFLLHRSSLFRLAPQRLSASRAALSVAAFASWQPSACIALLAISLTWALASGEFAAMPHEQPSVVDQARQFADLSLVAKHGRAGCISSIGKRCVASRVFCSPACLAFSASSVFAKVF
jgi:hypothetical protein